MTSGNRNIEFVCKPTPRNLGLQNTEREFENSRHLQITGIIIIMYEQLQVLVLAIGEERTKYIQY